MAKFQNYLKRLWKYFTAYEKGWFISITCLAVLFAFIFPEEDVNGVSGGIIMALYLVNIISNITCELLISKQSKYNFLVSLVVEVTEIIIPIILVARFATMAVTIFFWIPIDLISYFVWKKHPDRQKQELTVVRKLNGIQSVLVIAGIVVWTVVVGYLLTVVNERLDLLEITGKLSDQPVTEQLLCYFDAACSAVGIANGLFILFRFREQWIAWYIASLLETVMNIMLGQWVLLILKAGYLSNTTYGFIKWTKYIKEQKGINSAKDNEPEIANTVQS